MTINLSEAKAHLGRYVARGSEGEVITICERNKPVAELRAAEEGRRAARLRLGGLKGQFEVPSDFDAPLPEFEAAFYEQPKRKVRSAR